MWLGPHDGQVVDVSAAVVRAGLLLVPDSQRERAYTQSLLTGKAKLEPAETIPPGRYELRRAPDGMPDTDTFGRLVFDWRGWQS